MNFLLINLAVCILASDFMVVGSELSALLSPDQDQQRQRCGATRVSGLIQVDCSNRGLHSVPNNLDSSAKVIVMSNNRLRKLAPGSFSRYTSLEYLWLDQNVILNITKETIDELPYVKLLDLSDNPLHNLPHSLFQLPYLQKLYLTTNELSDSTLETVVTSPLEFLEAAENHFTKIPSIGPQWALATLNLSSNKLTHISTEDVAPFCALRILDLTNNRIKFNESSCDCILFKSWARIRNMNVTPEFSCNNANLDSCSRVTYSNKTMESFQSCLEIMNAQAAAVKAKSTWTIVGSCVGAFLACLIVWFCCMFKKNKKKNRKLKEEQRLAANNANTELLNGNLPEQLSVKTLHE